MITDGLRALHIRVAQPRTPLNFEEPGYGGHMREEFDTEEMSVFVFKNGKRDFMFIIGWHAELKQSRLVTEWLR
jgi:hypothetical protein